MVDYDPDRVRKMKRPHGLPFSIGKIGHVVLNVQDVERSAQFYTQVLGFQISDVYPEEMVPGGMVFLRCNSDHHGIALVGSTNAPAENVELNHIAFEVATLDEVLRARDHPRRHGVKIDFEGRRRAGCQLRGRVSRPRQPPARNLLGHRPDRQRRCCPPGCRVEGRAQPRRRAR
jgi:catechol 2,3-dioxygenase-like lactoylglutathione lyase family enzyme